MSDPWDVPTPAADPKRPLPKLQNLVFAPFVALGQSAAQIWKTHQLQSRIEGHFDSAAGKYKLGGRDVSVRPFFRMSGGWTERHLSVEGFKQLVADATHNHDRAFLNSVNMCAYGKGSPEDVRRVTQALIDSGKLEEVRTKYQAIPAADFVAQHGDVNNHPLSDEDAIRLLQWDYGVGIDCSGYVEPAFLAAHGGSAKDYHLDERDNLYNLKNNPAFTRELTPIHAQSGDLMILNAPARELEQDRNAAGHTVLVRDRHEVGTAERGTLHGLDGFAGAGDKVHMIQVDASWGAGKGNLEMGGVQTRAFLYDETTGKWADVNPKTGAVVPNEFGPYGDHTVEGVYHPKH